MKGRIERSYHRLCCGSCKCSSNARNIMTLIHDGWHTTLIFQVRCGTRGRDDSHIPFASASSSFLPSVVPRLPMRLASSLPPLSRRNSPGATPRHGRFPGQGRFQFVRRLVRNRATRWKKFTDTWMDTTAGREHATQRVEEEGVPCVEASSSHVDPMDGTAGGMVPVPRVVQGCRRITKQG